MILKESSLQNYTQGEKIILVNSIKQNLHSLTFKTMGDMNKEYCDLHGRVVYKCTIDFW
jgi:hypothetical protein